MRVRTDGNKKIQVNLPGHNQPGVLFIGAGDNGVPSGLAITEQLLLSLADMKTDGNILPLPVLSVEKRKLKGAEMAVVTVMPSDMPPVKYEGRIWVRTGPRRSIANAQDERILNEKRRYRNMSFDNHPIPAAAIRDLSRTIFENEYLPSAFADDVLKTFGFIQTFGRGIAVARSAMKENGNPPLEFQTSQTAVLCTLRGRS